MSHSGPCSGKSIRLQTNKYRTREIEREVRRTIRSKALSIVALLVFSMFSGFLIVVPFVPSAHAANPTVNNTANCKQVTGTCTTGSLTISGATDIVIVTFQTVTTGSSCAFGTLSNSQSYAFTAIVAGCTKTLVSANGDTYTVAGYYFTVTSTTALTVGLTQGGDLITYMQVFDTTGVNTNLLDSEFSTCDSSCSATFQTSGSSSYAAGGILFNSAYMAGVLTSLGGGGGLTCATSQNWVTNFAAADKSGGGAYCIPTTSSTTTYSGTASANTRPQLILGMLLQPPPLVTLPLACTLSGAPASLSPQAVTLTGGSPSPSPSTANCSTGGTTTNLSVQQSTTITATAPSCTVQYCFYFQSGNTWTTTATKVSCASGTCATWTLTLFALSPAGPPILGNCPGTKNDTTFAMANSTVYLSSFIFGAEPTIAGVQGGQGFDFIPSIEVSISSVTSVTVQESLNWGLYATTSPGSVSVSNPLLIVGSGSISLTPGTKNSVVQTYGYAAQLTSIGGQTFAIALYGNSKISLNESELKFTSIGTGFTTLPPLTTTLGSTLTKGLFACSLLYSVPQEITTTTIATTTSTTTSTSFGQTVTTTATNIVNTPPPTSNWFLASFYLMLPVAFTLSMVLIIEAIRRIRN